MSSPNTAPSSETTTHAQQTFEIIRALDTNLNLEYVAIEEIKGATLAKLFLSGYAEHLFHESSDEAVKAAPLDAAFAIINHAANYYVVDNGPDDSAREQFVVLIKPWLEAYLQLTEQSVV